MLRLEEASKTIVDDIFDAAHRAEEERRREYLSALNIQAWFRGSRVRKYLSNLNFNATQIQRVWRGYLGRRVYNLMVKNALYVMREKYFNSLVVKVQTRWRGYYVRKYVHNYYALKQHLKEVEAANETIREKLQDYEEQQEIKLRKERVESAYQRLLADAKSKHHLISTIAVPGVYKSPFKDYPEEMEYRLQAVRPLVASQKKTEEVEKRKKEKKEKEKKVLPPIKGPIKPQGPFKSKEETLQQRHRPGSPTLRVETSYYSTLEARETMRGDEKQKRVVDDIFRPFAKVKQTHVPLHHSSTAFGPIAYGTQKFRDNEFQPRLSSTKDSKLATTDFKTVVPPIPLFDKFCKTYSKGQVQ